MAAPQPNVASAPLPWAGLNGYRHMMSHRFAQLRRSLGDVRGATMAEYAILVAVIAIVVILGAKALGSSVSEKLDAAATNVSTGT